MRLPIALLAAAALAPVTLPAAPARAQAGGGVIAYVRDADGPGGAEPTMYVARPDGTGERVFATGGAPSLSPTGDGFAYVVPAGGARQLVVGRLGDGGSFRQVTALPDREAEFGPGRYGVTGSAWSPGGTWLALRLMAGSTTTLGFVRPDGAGYREVEFGHLFGSTIAWRDDTTVAVGTDQGLRLVTVDGAVTEPPGLLKGDTPAAWFDDRWLAVNTPEGVDLLDVTSGKRSTLRPGATAWGAYAGGVVYTTEAEVGHVRRDGSAEAFGEIPAGGNVLGTDPLTDGVLVEVADASGIRLYAATAPAGLGGGVGGAGALRPAAVTAVATGSEGTSGPGASYDAVEPPASPPATDPGSGTPSPPVVTDEPVPDPPDPGPGDPDPVAVPAPADPGPGRSAFVDAVPAAGEVSTDGRTLAVNALVTLLLMLLITFPAELFNSTLEKHYDEVRGWFRRAPRPATPPHARPRAVRVALFVAYTAVAALLYGLLDPSFGLDGASARLWAGLLLGLVAITLAFGAAPLAYARRRYRERGALEVLPGTLLVGVVCVVISRAARFEPGYLYGIVGGFAFARTFTKDEEGRNALVTGAGALVLSVLAWALWQPVDAAARDGDPGLLLGLVDSTLATVAVGGLQGLVIGLVPVHALPGHALASWRRPAWAALYGVSLFAFVHLLLRPGGDTSQEPFLTWLGLFVGFGAVSVAFWGYFRLRASSG